MITVLFTNKYDADTRAFLRERLKKAASVYFFEAGKEDAPADVLKKAEVIVGWVPIKPLLERAENCVLFQTPSVGVSGKRLEFFREHPEIKIANSHANAYAVAQHSLALLLSLCNRIIPYHLDMISGEWTPNSDYISSIVLKNKTAGLLGFGAVGRQIRDFLSPFQLDFIACTYSGKGPAQKVKKYFRYDDRHNFLKHTDILFAALPLTRETRGMIGQEELRLLGKEGIIINVSRGAVIQEKALYDALKNEVIAGAGLDVWYDYDPETQDGKKYPFHYPFHELSRLVCSPHRAASPFTAQDRWDDVMENINKVNAGRRDFVNLIDPEKGY